MRRLSILVRLSCALACALVAFVSARLALPSLTEKDLAGGTRLRVGRVASVDVFVHLGNIAVPNPMTEVAGDPGRYEINPRVAFWDAYAITAPVPDVVDTPDGMQLIVPWTLLPSSVAHAISQLDDEFGARFALRVGLKERLSDWQFERIDHISVPDDSAYRRICGVRSVYSVNMFDFLKDFGDDYKDSLRYAVSSSVMEVVQNSASNGDTALAFPAMAGAQHVQETHLVITYADSFGAILDGLSRAQGAKPSKAYLVVWNELVGHQELQAAIGGLQEALYRELPDWRDRLRSSMGTAIAGCFVLGVAFASLYSRRPLATRLNLFKCMLVTFVLVLDAKYTSWIGQYLPAAALPCVSIAILSGLAFAVGVELRSRGLVEGGEDTSKAGG